MPMHAWHLFILLMAHPHMPFYYATATAQSDDMSLISIPPATSVAATSTAAPAAAATTTANTDSSSSGNTIISYPSGAPTINYEDTVLVSYNTPWNSATLTLWCEDGPAFVSYNANNIPSSGTYNLSPVEGSLDVSKYPSLCHISLSDSANSANSVNGGDFTLVSTVGAAKTYAASTTVTAAKSARASTAGSESGIAAHTTLSASSRNSSQLSSSSTSGSSDAGSVAAASSTSTATSTSTSNSGLSGGAKAGIAISVILIIALLILAAFFFRRQRQRHNQQLQAVQSELASERAQRASEKAYLDSILTVAGKPDTEHGGKIRIADDVRQSGDWRRFFGSKAASAAGSVAGAAAAVGAAISNSRPGSRRASMARSRLGTSDGKDKDLPAVPAIPNSVSAVPPSPTVTDSVTGRGSLSGPSETGEARSTTALIPPGKK